MHKITRCFLGITLAVALAFGVFSVVRLPANAEFAVDLETVNAPLLNENGVIENNGSLTCPACGAKNITWV